MLCPTKKRCKKYCVKKSFLREKAKLHMGKYAIASMARINAMFLNDIFKSALFSIGFPYNIQWPVPGSVVYPADIFTDNSDA